MQFEKLKAEYAQLWATMATRSSFKPALDASAQKIIANKERYDAVAEMTKVPWYVIGLIHQMEAGCSFGCHLHNGDSLARRTVQVPANRPSTGNGPYKWEVSACDALLMKHLDTVTEWTIERISFELERYNGWGYRKFHKTTLTPYLWSGTTHYARGKYVADGKWDLTHVSKQSGAMAILKRLMEIDATIAPGAVPVEAAPPTPEPTFSDSFVKADEKAPVSKPAVAAAAATVATVAQVAAPALPLPPVPEVVTQSILQIESWKSIGGQAWTLLEFGWQHPVQSTVVAVPLLALWFWPKSAGGQ